MVAKEDYNIHVVDFGNSWGNNLLIEVIDGNIQDVIFIKKYTDPKEARCDLDKILTTDGVDEWDFEDFDFWGGAHADKVIYQDGTVYPEHFTHLGRAMFPEYFE